MTSDMTRRLDDILQRAVSGSPALPGVVAGLSDAQGSLYQGAAGVATAGAAGPMHFDSELAIFSCTKPIAAVALLQLVEDGRLDLDAPARTYLPALGEARVLEGFDADGRPRTRAPKRDVTVRMLMLHTAGFGYDNFNEQYRRLVDEGHLDNAGLAGMGGLTAPLLFEPGDDWEYGLGMDWAGLVVESLTGQRLGEVMRERIFEPLGMTSTAFTMTPAMRSRLASLHVRDHDGVPVPIDYVLPQDPDIHMAGHGLYSTASDFMRFIRMWLNDGAGPAGRVLRAETVATAYQNGLGQLKVKPLPGVREMFTVDVDMFPEITKSWALGGMVNDAETATGRSAGSLSWAGIANSYYWLDRSKAIGGFWSTQVFPFLEPTSWQRYLEFESAAYALIPAPVDRAHVVDAGASSF